MAPPTYDFLKSENARLQALLEAAPPALSPDGLYLGKSAQQWSEEAIEAQRELAQVKAGEVSPGQQMANAMKAGREGVNTGVRGAA